jgi:hypothetical protein
MTLPLPFEKDERGEANEDEGRRRRNNKKHKRNLDVSKIPSRTHSSATTLFCV